MYVNAHSFSQSCVSLEMGTNTFTLRGSCVCKITWSISPGFSLSSCDQTQTTSSHCVVQMWPTAREVTVCLNRLAWLLLAPVIAELEVIFHLSKEQHQRLFSMERSLCSSLDYGENVTSQVALLVVASSELKQHPYRTELLSIHVIPKPLGMNATFPDRAYWTHSSSLRATSQPLWDVTPPCSCDTSHSGERSLHSSAKTTSISWKSVTSGTEAKWQVGEEDRLE